MAKSRLNQRLKDLDKAKAAKAAAASRGGPAPPRFGGAPVDDAPVELAAFILTAFLGTIVLVALAALFGLRSVRDDIHDRTVSLLAEAGIDGIEVSVSGRDVHIVGTVDAFEKMELAQTLPGGLVGVGNVSTNIAYVEPRTPSDTVIVADPLVVTWVARRAVVTGTLSDEATVASVVAVIDDAFTAADTGGLTVKEGLASERDWLPPVMTLLRRMAESVTDGEIIVNPSANVIKVSAEFETRQEQHNLRDQVEDILAAVTFDFSSGLTVKDQPRVTEEEVEETQERFDDTISGKVVEFEFGSAVIAAEGRDLLGEVLAVLRDHPLVGVEIAGHTDDVGTPESNLELSQARAEAVVAFFVTRGEDPAKFVVVGYGETRPVASNDTDEGRARNRRIEFTAIFDESTEEGVDDAAEEGQ
jgi:OOP family OmpA-OmpF porin